MLVAQEFRTGKTKFLIATDVLCRRAASTPHLRSTHARSPLARLAAETRCLRRGIDIPAVNFVINFDLPMVWEEASGPQGRGKQTDRVDLDTYLHRAGRCARYTNKGAPPCRP
eukprot:COSAG04_NODE_468_length_13857_cov_28.468382_11_plen_113_part_00